MKSTVKSSNSESATMVSFVEQFVSEGHFLNAIMELTAYERGWGPVPSATSMTILAEQRGSAYTSSAPTTTRISKATPITTKETKSAYTLTSYYDLARRAPVTERVPYLPQFCPHTTQPCVSPSTSGCASCTVQLLACDIWFWRSSASTGVPCAPPVLPAKCAVEIRSVYYALGIPLGEFDRSLVDQNIVKSILIPRRAPVAFRFRGDRKSAERESSRTRTLFRRACHVLSAPLRAPVMAMPR